MSGALLSAFEAARGLKLVHAVIRALLVDASTITNDRMPIGQNITCTRCISSGDTRLILSAMKTVQG
jgi:hypothetical protein